MSSLSEMPDVVFIFRMTLRKVSLSFRDLIDDTIPEVYFDSIHVTLCPEKLVVKWGFQNDVIEVIYQNEGNGSWISSYHRETFIDNTNSFEMFFCDLKTTLKHLKSKTREFRLFIDEKVVDRTKQKFMDKLIKCLEKQSVITQCLSIGATGAFDFLSIIPLFSSKFPTELDIFNSKFINEALDLKDIVLLYQWKSAKIVTITNFMLTSKKEDFAHFDEINLSFDTISAEDMVYFKEVATQNPNFVKFELSYVHFDNIQRIFELFGPTYIPTISTGRNKKQWFFKTRKHWEVLSIVFYPSFGRVNYNLINRENVSRNANILD